MCGLNTCTNTSSMDRIKLAELFAHEKWANKEILSAAGDKPSEKFVVLMSHIILAQDIWISRLSEKMSTTHPWDTMDVSKMADRIQDNYEELLQIVKLKDLNAPVKYKNTKGETFSNSAIDILMHLLLHSQYHRGQLASDIKANGGKAPGTDYIFYKR